MSVSLPKYDDFMAPTLRVLRELGGSGSNEELQDKLSATMRLSQDQLEAAYPTSGVAIASDRMTWARSYLKIAGLVESGGRALWVLTDAGRDAADWPTAKLKRFVADRFNVHERKRREARAALASADSVEEEVQIDADEPDNNIFDWRDELLNALKSMEPSAFERLCQRLLRESGFVKVEVTGKSGDGGIDGVGVLRMNLISFQVLFQCKRWAGSVSSPTVRDFRGAMQGRADKGLIITTGAFTADARREATRDGAPAIDLVDGELLCELLKDKRLGLTVREVRTEEVSVDIEFLAAV